MELRSSGPDGGGTIDYLIASTVKGCAEPLFSAYPGQRKIERGIFAHYGPDGLTIRLGGKAGR